VTSVENKSFVKLSDLSRIEIVNILNEVFKGYILNFFWTIQTLEKDLKENDISLQDSFVLMLNKEPIGIALLSFRDVRCKIDIMGIVKKHRRSGYGFEVVDRVIEICRWKGVKKIILEVPKADKAAFSFYEKFGFKETRILETFNRRTDKESSSSFHMELSDIKLITNYAHESYGKHNRSLNWMREPSNLPHLSFYNSVTIKDPAGKTVGFCIWGHRGSMFYIIDLAPLGQISFTELLGEVLKMVSETFDYVLIASVPRDDPLAASAEELGFRSILTLKEMVFNLH